MLERGIRPEIVANIKIKLISEENISLRGKSPLSYVYKFTLILAGELFEKSFSKNPAENAFGTNPGKSITSFAAFCCSALKMKLVPFIGTVKSEVH